MTRKDFIVIAEVLSEAKYIETLDETTHQRIVGEFVRRLKRTNPLFDIDKFVRASGMAT